jgi:hypothetical protein
VMFSVDKSPENLQRTIGAIIQYLHTWFLKAYYF